LSRISERLVFGLLSKRFPELLFLQKDTLSKKRGANRNPPHQNEINTRPGSQTERGRYAVLHSHGMQCHISHLYAICGIRTTRRPVRPRERQPHRFLWRSSSASRCFLYSTGEVARIASIVAVFSRANASIPAAPSKTPPSSNS
jgi:hypothetical protein